MGFIKFHLREKSIFNSIPFSDSIVDDKTLAHFLFVIDFMCQYKRDVKYCGLREHTNADKRFHPSTLFLLGISYLLYVLSAGALYFYSLVNLFDPGAAI